MEVGVYAVYKTTAPFGTSGSFPCQTKIDEMGLMWLHWPFIALKNLHSDEIMGGSTHGVVRRTV